MVDAELYARYQTALSTVGELSSDSVKKLLAQLDGMTEAEQAAYLLAYYPELAREYSALSSDVARQYYQDARDAEGLSSEYLAQEASPVPEEWLQGDVADAFLGNAGMTPAKLPGKAAKRAMQSAERTIVHNCQRDPAHPRWAFVPNVMACPWCIMIGSNGFVFRSQQTASAERHLHCTCAVVADFDTDNPALEGYDPKGMYDRMMECADAAGKPGDWDAARKEAAHRDREWLRTGEEPTIDYSEKSRNTYGSFLDDSLPLDQLYQLSNITGRDSERKDLFAHDMLKAAGYQVKTHETVDKGGYTNLDIDLGGRRCEVKSPDAAPNPASKDELKFVKRNVSKASKQFREDGTEYKIIVLSNYYTGFFDEDEERVYQRFCKELDGHGFSEGLFIGKDGTVLRAK